MLCWGLHLSLTNNVCSWTYQKLYVFFKCDTNVTISFHLWREVTSCHRTQISRTTHRFKPRYTSFQWFSPTSCTVCTSNAHSAATKALESLHKQALKTLDKKPFRFHHCHILKKYKLLSGENLIIYKNICLVYRILNSLHCSSFSSIQTNKL